MAWRIDEAVIRGEIDNTIEGRTTGRIWLLGRDAPLQLTLEGDCWRDLAGTCLQFVNPSPRPGAETTALAADQSGVIGDMTASRKCKVPLVSHEELHRLCCERLEIPHEWRNTLYLEWFGEFNGRVIIESSSYELSISAHAWELDEDAEAAQKLANLNSMRDFMALVIQRRDVEDSDADAARDLDEFVWEERLKESDRLADAYQEVLEKYLDDPDSERKEAFVMGWDGLLDALADSEEAEGADDYEDAADDFWTGAPAVDDSGDCDDAGCGGFDDDAGFDSEESDRHPLQVSAQALASQAMDLLDREDGAGTPAYLLITNLLQVSGKLASVLNCHCGGYHPETGFVLAVLKRCLNWLNQSLGACQSLHDATRDPARRAGFMNLQAAVFQIRDQIVELRRNFKQT